MLFATKKIKSCGLYNHIFDLILKRTHLLLLALDRGPAGLCAVDLEALGHLEQVRHVGVLPSQQDGPVLLRETLQVDKVGHHVPDEEDLTGFLESPPAVGIERSQLVRGLDHVYPGCTV